MKKILSLLLVTVLLTLAVSAFADEPFAKVLNTVMETVHADEDGFTLNFFEEDECLANIAVQKKDGSFDKLSVKIDSMDTVLYVDTEKLTISENGTSFTIPYAQFDGLSVNTEALSQLGQTLGSMATELMNELLIKGGIAVEMTENGMILKIQAKEFFSCLDSAVASLLRKYAGQIEDGMKAAFGEKTSFSAAELIEGWNALKVAGVRPGFDTVTLSLDMISVATDTLKLAVDVDGNTVFELIGTEGKNGFSFTVRAAGHTYFLLLEQAADQSGAVISLYMDNSQLMAVSYTENALRFAMMDSSLTVDVIPSEDGITLNGSYDGGKIAMSINNDPFTITETIAGPDGSSKTTVIRQVDSEGSVLCRLDVEQSGVMSDGTEAPVSGGSLMIRETENGYTLDSDLEDGETVKVLEILLDSAEVLVPDEGIVLTQKMLTTMMQ